MLRGTTYTHRVLDTGEIETRAIFVDTSVFVSTNFGGSALFRSLVTMANKGGASFILADITIKEVKSNIASSVRESIRELKRLSSKVKILSRSEDSGLSGLFKKYDEDALTEAVWAQLEQDLSLGNLQLVPVANVNPDRVFSRYFQKEAPFADGKKKSEFPDAFAICALEDWCTANSSKLYVLSEDEDWKKACLASPQLIHIALSDLVEMLWKEENANRLSFFKNNFGKMKEAIEKAFLNAGTVLMDEDGDINSLSINSMEVEIESVIDLPDGVTALVCSAVVDFTADVTFADPNATTYDRESGHTWVWHYKDDSLDRTEELDVEVKVKQKDSDYEVLSVVINSDLPISVEVEDSPDLYR